MVETRAMTALLKNGPQVRPPKENEEGSGGGGKGGPTREPPKKPGRYTRYACDACKRHKVKCNVSVPHPSDLTKTVAGE
jgi:hypothetical protein